MATPGYTQLPTTRSQYPSSGYRVATAPVQVSSGGDVQLTPAQGSATHSPAAHTRPRAPQSVVDEGYAQAPDAGAHGPGAYAAIDPGPHARPDVPSHSGAGGVSQLTPKQAST